MSKRQFGGGIRGVLVGAKVVAALLSLLVLVGAGYAWASYRNFSSHVTTIDAIAPISSPSNDSSGTTVASPQAKAGGTEENILLVGDDHRPPGATAAQLAQLNTGQDGGSLNTDTMMVMHIPADGSKATVISFPRDSWVNIPGFGMNKLNAAFEFGTQSGGGDAGGARLLIQVIQNMTGLTINHFVRVSMLGFYDIAQVLGPIKVCLNEHAVDSYSGTNLPAGVSYLNPSQALAFVRQRHNLPRGDLDREVRQQYFLSAALSKVTSAGTLLNPFKLQALLSAVSSSLETDTGFNLLSFASQFSDLGSGNVTYATIPITGTPTITVNGNDVSIVSVDLAAVHSFIATVVGPPSAYAAAKALAPSAVTVTVLNGSSTDGAATQNSTALDQLGFHTTTPGSTTPAATTTIEYRPGMEAQAKTLAAYVPGAAVTASTAISGVTLILGSDGNHVAATPPAGDGGTPTQTTTTANGPTRAYGTNDCIN